MKAELKFRSLALPSIFKIVSLVREPKKQFLREKNDAVFGNQITWHGISSENQEKGEFGAK